MVPDEMSPSYRVPPATEGGPPNEPVSVWGATDARVAAETIAMLPPSPTATTPPDVTVTPPITKPPSVKQCFQMKAPVDGFRAFTVPEHEFVLSPPTYSVVPSNAADA